MDIEKEISYIYSYIKYVYFPIEEFSNKKFLLDISRRIKDSMSSTIFSNGNYNFLINNFVNKEMKLRNSKSFLKYENIRNHLYLLINYYRMKMGGELDNYQIILNELMRYAYRFDEEGLISGKYEEELESVIPTIKDNFIPLESINNVYIDVSHISLGKNSIIDDNTAITDYIKKYIKDYKEIFEFDGDFNYLSNIISSDISRSKISTTDILSHRYDAIIDEYIKKEKLGIKLKDKFKKVEMEVSNYVYEHHTFMEIDGFEKNLFDEVYIISRELVKSKCKLKDLTKGKYNDYIEKHLRYMCNAKNSTLVSSINKIELKTRMVKKQGKELLTITLENNLNYSILHELINNNVRYIYLSNLYNSNDCCIRKIITNDKKDYLCRLSNGEFNSIYNLFIKENKDITG